MFSGKENNLLEVYEWARSELLELEAITEVFKSYDKWVLRIKAFMVKYRIDESKLLSN